MTSNPELEKEPQDASMPTIFSLEASDGHEDHDTEGGTVLDPPVSKTTRPTSVTSVKTQSKSETTVSKLQAALTAPRTIFIPKPPTSAPTSPTAALHPASLVKIRGSIPRRQLQFLCQDGRVKSVPLAVGIPSPASAASEEPASQSAAAALPQARSAPEPAEAAVVVEDAVVTAESVELVPESPYDQPEESEWVVEVTGDDQPTDPAAGGDSVVNTVEVEDTVAASPLESRLVLNTDRSLVESSGASAALNAVESAAAAARAAAVSHVVFESDGRAVGALMPAPGEGGEQGQQQVMLAGRWPDVLTVNGNLLGTAGDSDGRQIVLQVDEESDSVTLLVDRLEEGAVYELAGGSRPTVDGGELLELWERDGSGEDRHLETVSEVSLVDIRAVCEQCGCAISHHMVGLLARKDGTEYGYRCRLCQCVQTDVDEMARHMDSHRPLADTQCRFCSRGLRTFRPQAARTYTCHACQMVFVSRHEMIKHREVHPPKRRFPCELCDKAFQMKVQLEVHMRTHLGHKPYACDMCPATFTQPSHLINHRRTHTGERPYACELCGRAFVQQGHLRAHERTHTGERPYKCDTCGRGFRQSGQLTAHKKLHEGDAPIKVRRRHGEPFTRDEVTCLECSKTFRLPKDLKRHMLVHGGGAFRCLTCNRAFKRRDHLQRHLRQHEKPPRERQRQRRRPPPPPPTPPQTEEQQEQGLTQLDRVIDAVLDEPEAQESVAATLKLEHDHGDLRVKVEEAEDSADAADSDDAVDDDEGEHEGDEDNECDILEDPVLDSAEDGDAEDEGHLRNTRVSRAPEDALWSQADCSDDLRWPRAERQRRPVGGAAYGRRSKLLPVPFTDNGIDEEMVMLTAALRERGEAGRQRKGRTAASGRPRPPEQTVKLEPVGWMDWEQSGETAGRRGEDEERREDEDWTGARRENTGGKRGRPRDAGAERAEDLVLSVWDEVDVTESAPSATGRQSTPRLSWLAEPQQVLRTSSRSTAGNWAANVGVSLARNSHHGGKR